MSPVLTTASVPDQDQFGYWGAAMSKSLMPVSTTRRADGPFSGQISTDRLGFLQLCTVEAEAHRVDRARTHIARSTEEFVVLAVQTAGTAILFQADRQATASQGDLLVYDAGRPYFLDYPETFSNHSIQIPRRALGVPDEDLHRVTGTVIDRSAGCGAVLTPFLTTLMTSASSYPAALAHGIASSTADLFATLVDEQIRTAVTGREPLCGFLLPRIRDHIDRNLGDPALGPEAIAKEHHISVRYLHRLFEAEGTTVSRLIQRRRLEMCARELTRGDGAGPPVSSVAQRWGFVSPSHFSRAFRKTYGITPRQWRGLRTGTSREIQGLL
ncbi:helix-turn-helix domain-containing protein [Streptomyces sp. NPDC056670]|uniref:helix-turn-helix domain-containing protein n=1 Tax=Streptomyces sp. NPDC056670 TaxID=3345904 RepID=UPI0036AD89E7